MPELRLFSLELQIDGKENVSGRVQTILDKAYDPADV